MLDEIVDTLLDMITERLRVRPRGGGRTRRRLLGGRLLLIFHSPKARVRREPRNGDECQENTGPFDCSHWRGLQSEGRRAWTSASVTATGRRRCNDPVTAARRRLTHMTTQTPRRFARDTAD